jgi:hypothetical protein
MLITCEGHMEEKVTHRINDHFEVRNMILIIRDGPKQPEDFEYPRVWYEKYIRRQATNTPSARSKSKRPGQEAHLCRSREKTRHSCV